MCLRLVIVYVFLLLNVVTTNSSFAQTTAAPPQPDASSPANEGLKQLAADPRLRSTIDFRVKWGRLSDILKAVSTETKTEIQAEPEIAERRLNLFTTRFTAAHGLVAIIRQMGLECTVTTVAGKPAYRLTLSESRREQEEKWKARSEEREKNRYAESERRMANLLQQAIEAGRKSQTPHIGNLLATYTPEQLAQIARVAQGDAPIISASNQSHFHNFMMHAVPYGELSPALQKQVEQTIAGPNYAQNGFAQGANSQGELQKCHVGVVACGGSIYVSLYNPAIQDVFIAPFGMIGAPTPLHEEINDFDPQVVAMLDSPRLVTGLPKKLAEKKIRIPKAVDRRHLANLLEEVTRQIPFSLICDDYLRTRVCHFDDLLPSLEEFTLRDALWQIARSFGYRMEYRNDALYITTLTPGADLRAEPPVGLLDYLQRIEKKKEFVTFATYQQLGNLSFMQAKTLALRTPSDILAVRTMLYDILQVHPILHLYGKLTPEQQKQAETADGLPLEELEKGLERQFAAHIGRGLPPVALGFASETMEYKPKRFYVRRQPQPNGTTETIAFLVTSGKKPATLSGNNLTVPLPPVSP
jgi:hypothetical protein